MLPFINKYLALAVFLLCMVITSWSLYHPEFFRVHDFTHATRIVEMLGPAKEGQIPVRWSGLLGYGYGMPTFLFYAPLPYIIGAIVYYFSGNLLLGVKALWLIPSVLSWIGMYLFARKHLGQAGGIVAATAFTLAPYRAVDLYVRGAIGEIWAIAMFPWILVAVERVIEYKKYSIILLGISLAALSISHNLMTLLFMPVALAYSLLLTRKVKQLIAIGGGFFLGNILALFYTLPSLGEKQFTQIDQRIFEGYFDYSLHFLYIRQFFKENWKYDGSVWGPDDSISFFLGYGQFALFISSVLATAVALYFFLKKKKANSLKSTEGRILLITVFMFAGFVGSLFMTLLRSKFVWDSVPILQATQFPWRFLSLAIFFLAYLCGVPFLYLKVSRVQTVLFAAALLMLSLPAIKYFRPASFLDTKTAFYYDDPERITKEMSGIWPDFIPKQMPEKLTPSDFLIDSIDSGFDRSKVQIEVDRAHELLFKTNFTAPTQTIIQVADFPGWQVYINNQPVDHQTTETGVIGVLIPENERTVALRLNRTPVRMFADILSVLAIFVCFVLYMLESQSALLGKQIETKRKKK